MVDLDVTSIPPLPDLVCPHMGPGIGACGWLVTACSPQLPAHCAVLAWELRASLENSILKLFSPVEFVCNWLFLIKYCINHIRVKRKLSLCEAELKFWRDSVKACH